MINTPPLCVINSHRKEFIYGEDKHGKFRGILKKHNLNLKVICILIFLINSQINSYAGDNNIMKVKLNPPHFKDNLKVLLEKRYSCRDFQDKILNLDDVATILWATAGKKYDSLTGATRTIPSAGATYPLEIYIVVGQNSIDRLKEGIYHYLIEEHSLEIVKEGDKRAELAQACLGQDFIKQAPASLVVVAKFYRTTKRYGSRGERYVYIEAGHACQNTYLAVSNLGLGTVEVGAFIDDYVKGVLNLDKESEPISVLPIGYAKPWGK